MSSVGSSAVPSTLGSLRRGLRHWARALGALASGRRIEAVAALDPAVEATPVAESADAPTSVTVPSPRRHRLAPPVRRRRPVSVLVPVYDALDDLQRCVASLVRNTSHPVTLLLIDDASPDPSVAPFLAELAASNDRIVVVTNEENLGFVGTVNRGFAQRPDDDVILLNSDTEVPPLWVEGLVRAAAEPTVATATALSDNAGAFSAPTAGRANPLPGSVDAVGRAVARHSGRIRPAVHTGNGFCMYVKREVIDELGGFDAEVFGRGYCEENDFCMRARASGWRNVVADDVYVVHHGSASFGADKADLLATNRALLDEIHPEYNSLVQEFLRSEDMAAARARVGEAFADVDAARPRVMFVLHAGGGGTPQTNADLMVGIAGRYEALLLRSDGEVLTLTDGVTGAELDRARLDDPITTTTFTDRRYAHEVERMIVDHAVEVVHVRHLQGHTHDVVHIADDLGVPVVMSLHDYYLACPSVQLLDEHDNFCGGTCTTGQGVCRTPPGLDDTPHLKHGFVHQWRARSQEMLDRCDAFVTTTDAAATVLEDAFPTLLDRLCVIEHGRDLDQLPSLAGRPDADGPARILVPGTIGIHKGAGLIEAIAELDVDDRLEFHLIGSITRHVSIPGLVDHGRYERDQFAALVAEIRPAATAVLSIWAETYSHTVTESWSVGVPVLGSGLGAVAERIRRHGGGWAIDTTDASTAYRQIVAALGDLPEWETQRAAASVDGLPSVAEMADRYVEIYDGVRHRRRVLRAS